MMHDRRLVRDECPPTRCCRFHSGREELVRGLDREGRSARRHVARKGVTNETWPAVARYGIPYEHRLTESRYFLGFHTAHCEPLVPKREMAQREALMELVTLQREPERHGCVQQQLACEPAIALRDQLRLRVLQLAELPRTGERSECCLNPFLRVVAVGQELYICCCIRLIARDGAQCERHADYAAIPPRDHRGV